MVGYSQLRHQLTASRDALNNSAVHIASTQCGDAGPPNNVYGWGRVDIFAAVGGGYTDANAHCYSDSDRYSNGHLPRQRPPLRQRHRQHATPRPTPTPRSAPSARPRPTPLPQAIDFTEAKFLVIDQRLVKWFVVGEIGDRMPRCALQVMSASLLPLGLRIKADS